jgi:hypothetical protein
MTGTWDNTRISTAIQMSITDTEKENAMKNKFYKLTLPDYEDEWVNRLAVILQMCREMDEAELSATLNFVVGKYRRVIKD